MVSEETSTTAAMLAAPSRANRSSVMINAAPLSATIGVTADLRDILSACFTALPPTFTASVKNVTVGNAAQVDRHGSLLDQIRAAIKPVLKIRERGRVGVGNRAGNHGNSDRADQCEIVHIVCWRGCCAAIGAGDRIGAVLA